MMASTTTSYPPNPQHDPAFQPINNFHGEPHREFPPRARVDSWHEPAQGLRNLTNGPPPTDQNLNPALHARPPSHPSSRRPSLAVEPGISNDIEKQPQQTAPPYPVQEKQTSPHAPTAPGSHPMQHRPTTVPPGVTAKREPTLQHLPPQTAPTSPSMPIQYSHHPIQPSQVPPPPPHPPTSHPPQGAYASIQPFAPNGPPPQQIIAPGPPNAQNYHHHSAPPPHMGYAGQPPSNIRRVSVGPGVNIPDSDEMSPMQSQFSYMGSTGSFPPLRRKAVRAAQACDACRTRKAKCDEGRPACAFCKENNSVCVYREVPPPKQDRTMIMIQQQVANIEKIVADETILNLLRDIHAAVSAKAAEGAHLASGSSSPEADMPEEEQQQIPHVDTVAQPTTHKAPIPPVPAPISQLTTPTQVPANFSIPTGTSHPVEPTKDDDNFVTIPHKHDTAAHKLLRWKSIRDLVDNRWPDNYVMNAEIKRGSLRFRGRGEENMDVDEAHGGYDNPQSMDYYQQEELEIANTHAMKGMGGRIGNSPKEILRVDMETSMDLLHNFLNNIYILHPFLDKLPLVDLVQHFANRHGAGIADTVGESNLHPTQSISPENSFSSMANSAMLDQSQYPGLNQYSGYNPPLATQSKAGSKRKRDSNIQPGPPPFVQAGPNSFYRQATPQDLPPQRIPDTLNSSIVLLVFALGAITGHKTPVPGALDPITDMNLGMANQFKHPSGIQQLSPQVHPHRDPLQNIDVIPGLAYCEKALQILALHQGRSEVEYVQACLLAGLYWGQLGRVMDSWKWISNACMACQIMINIRLPAETGRNGDAILRDTMVRTFWSCVQLESDLLAELDVPRSGITRLEGSDDLRMSIDGKIDDNLEMWLYFMAQYHIRKILNQVHSELYKQTNALTSKLNTAQILMQSLEAWRKTLPPPLQWSDSDPPSSDINAARLRAKYYGAKYVINRPFVEYFIHKTSSGNLGASPALSLSSLSQSSPPTSAHTPLADNRRTSVADDNREVPASYTSSCKTCLEAAVQSTSAFHGFDVNTNRPILTNIFGTAHAQFGNLLVLQAAYRHPKLKQFVDKDVLGELLAKTLEFLRTLSPISPSLTIDIQILEEASSHLDFFHNA